MDNDVLMGALSDKVMDETKEELGSKHEIMDMEKPNKVLGISLIIDENNGSITIHQKQLIEKVITNYDQHKTKIHATPCQRQLIGLPTKTNPVKGRVLHAR
ncbi:hypothetical protein C0989_000531 [Termitomyces sp. Mn162]|nr:hypothetical protein C0989_000531 [Termitomyces sp. Mn162]